MCHRKLKTPPGLHNCRLLPRKRSRSKPCKTPETSEPKRCKKDFMIAPSESTGNLKPQSILRSNVQPLLGLRLGRAVLSLVLFLVQLEECGMRILERGMGESRMTEGRWRMAKCGWRMTDGG